MSNTLRFPTIKGNYLMMTPAGAHAARQSGNVSPQSIWQFYGGNNTRPHSPHPWARSERLGPSSREHPKAFWIEAPGLTIHALLPRRE